MKVLLIANRGGKTDFKVLVYLHTEKLVNKVRDLLHLKKEQEAFELITREAEVTHYLPPGEKIRIRPHVILVEDIL